MSSKEGGGSEQHPEKRSWCQRLCQSRLCLSGIFLAVAAGIAVAVVVVLLSDSIRGRFPPQQPWWQKRVLYQVYPLSFQDSNNDGMGDLNGITSRLDNLTYLNVGAIWLSPFYPTPLKDFGYDVSNHTDVDPRFGTLQDFDVMLRKAHDIDIKVIIDFVAGHTSWKHEWFKNSQNRMAPYEDYYIWANGTTLSNGTHLPPNNWVSVFGHSAWTWSDVRKQFYYHAFLQQQPTLNYRNQLVVDEMKNVLRFWLERGVDGIRVDAVSNIMVSEDLDQDQVPSNVTGAQEWEWRYYVNNLTRERPEIRNITQGWRKLLDSYDDSDNENDNSKCLIVELYATPEERRKYYDYGADLPLNMDFLQALDHSDVNHCDAICLRDVILAQNHSLPDGKWANFLLSNHDNHRASSRLGARYVDAANMLLLTLRGTPVTYYGEEIGMQDIHLAFNNSLDPYGKVFGTEGYEEMSRDGERSPMQWTSDLNAGFSNHSTTWLPLNPDYHTRNVQVQKLSTNVTNIQVYQELSLLRDEPAFRYGFFEFADVTPSILSYVRRAVGYADYLVVINFGNTTIPEVFPRPPLNSTDTAKLKVISSDAANEGRFVKDKEVTLTALSLEPGDGLVLELTESESER